VIDSGPDEWQESQSDREATVNGHVRRRGDKWEILLEHGEQAALQCPRCRRAKRYWSDGDAPLMCPTCGGQLAEIVARRQELLPGRYRTKKLAETALRKELHEREQGDYVKPSELTVGEYLSDRWLPSLDAEELAPSTVLAYGLDVKRIVPYLGHIPLQKLNRNDVAVMASKLTKVVSRRTGRPLSAETRRGVLVTLHRAMGDAVTAELLRSNPVAGVKRPKVRRPELKTWTGPELATFLAATRDDRLGPLWHLLAMSGLRRGEALGLQWGDVDLEAGRLSIQRQRVQAGYAVEERQTKTGRGRPVSIDAGTVAILRQQSDRQLEDAARWGETWTATGHVFTREDGRPWHPDRVRVLFGEALEGVDVPRIRMHDLRHTWATLALRAGVHPKVVQERLGHANISITMDIYSHVLPDLQESAAELVAAQVALSGDAQAGSTK